MELIDSIKERMSFTLPGQIAQAEMLHLGRFENPVVPEKYKKASVLILLFQKKDTWYTVLMKRTSRFKNDKHKGQISFPGGQAEPFDVDKAATALRETEEEIGVPASDITILGGLTDLYIPVSNFLVNPYVGYYEGEPDFRPEKNEVAEIIQVPLSELLNDSIRKIKDLDLPNGFTLENVPYFDIENHVVWGATSMILSEFIHVLKASGFE